MRTKRRINSRCCRDGSDLEHEEEVMERFIPYEKLSKKEKRKLDQARRQTWGDLNPVTRKPENSRAYNRQKIKAQAWT